MQEKDWKTSRYAIMYPETAESVKRRAAMHYLCNVFRNTEDGTDRRPCHGKRAAIQARQEGGDVPSEFYQYLKNNLDYD